MTTIDIEYIKKIFMPMIITSPLISMLITIVRRASCMNACNIKHVWYCKHSCSWLDERTTSVRRALVEPARRASFIV